MRVLLVTYRLPWPLAQGMNLRVYNFAKELARRCDLDLLVMHQGLVPPEVSDVFGEVETVPRLAPLGRQGLVDRMLHALALEHVEPRSPAMADCLARRLASGRYDAVWATTHVLHFFSPRSRPPLVVDVIDDAVLQFRRDLRGSHDMRQFLSRLRYLLLHVRHERKYLSPAYTDAAFYTSEVDAAVLRRLRPETRTLVIENGVDTDYFQPMAVDEVPDSLVFEGNMSHPPNAEGALYFCREVFPRVREALPGARFTIVGKDPPEAVRALADTPGVEVTGFVDDVRPYVARASVFVCPLLSGGGIKNKLLQAWAMGKPSVVTSYSTGGLRVEEGVNALVRDGAVPLAEAICGLLRDEDLRARMRIAARRTVEDHYGWSCKAEELHALLQSVVAERQGRAGRALGEITV